MKLCTVWHAMSIVKIYNVFVMNSCLAMSVVSLGKYYQIQEQLSDYVSFIWMELYKPADRHCTLSFRQDILVLECLVRQLPLQISLVWKVSIIFPQDVCLVSIKDKVNCFEKQEGSYISTVFVSSPPFAPPPSLFLHSAHTTTFHQGTTAGETLQYPHFLALFQIQ